MHHAVEHALRLTDDIRPIRSRLGEDGYYHLRSKTGEKGQRRPEMKCSRLRIEAHWRNVGYTAAKRGLSYDQVKVDDQYPIANEWIREGMARWQRRAARADNREDGT